DLREDIGLLQHAAQRCLDQHMDLMLDLGPAVAEIRAHALDVEKLNLAGRELVEALALRQHPKDGVRLRRRQGRTTRTDLLGRSRRRWRRLLRRVRPLLRLLSGRALLISDERRDLIPEFHDLRPLPRRCPTNASDRYLPLSRRHRLPSISTPG